MSVQHPAGLIPVGCGGYYLKSLTGTPTLTDEFLELNGQSISDAQSVLNTQSLPNMSGYGGGTKRFLRGSSTSGTTGGSETGSHTHDLIPAVDQKFMQGEVAYGHPVSTVAPSILPVYYEAVPIVRIK